MESLKCVIMERDGISEAEYEELLQEAQEAILNGENPEDVCMDYFGIEPDFVFDLLEGLK